MILCFNCSRQTKEILDQMLQSGHYDDYAEIISIAVSNLAVLESEIHKKGALVLGEDAAQQDSSKLNPENVRKDRNIAQPTSIATESGVGLLSKSAEAGISIPRIFLLNDISKSAYQPVNQPSDAWIMGQEVPIDRWVFGQYNRLLPAKANCRALAHHLIQEKKGVYLEDIVQSITPEAAILGDYLKRQDQRHEISRDDLLSTAFPTTEKNSEKSYLRYANQFIGSVNREGQVSGLLIALKLINRTGNKKVRIHLTEHGWRLATMPNPILDNLQESPLRKFSEEEINFFINHISERVPTEDFAYRTIMASILEGANTPDSMDDYLQKRVAVKSEKELSASFLSTQRSGAVSRMTDLELVIRVRDGVKVTYEMTDLGKEYFSKRH